jgi:hypothetical protein
MDNLYINNYSLTEIIGLIIINWYWVILPFILFVIFKKAWLFWRRELWEAKQKYFYIEMVMPSEVMRPISSMDHILNSLWTVYSGIEGMKKFRKKWITGKKLENFSIEICSKGPQQRFFIRSTRHHADTIKAAFYSQYPSIEFREVREDYTREISWNIPNKEWNFYGLDQVLKRKDVFPVKTYTQFFEMKPENIKEEKRIDPITILLENLSCLRNDEIIWLQMKFIPVTKKDSDFFSRGRRTIDKLVNRESKKSNQANEIIPSEMKLTPREREIVLAAEKKLGQNIFKNHIRAIYFGKGKSFDPARKSLIEGFFSSFSQPDQNEFGKLSRTKTKLYHFYVKRRLFIRKRNMFRRYVLRESPFFPKYGGFNHLSTEEAATIFHPPIELHIYSADVQRVRSAKGAAPANLPGEL